jgi:phosphate starvation-inducible PhoH-like protein
LKEVAPRNPTQEEYLRGIESHIVTFGVGPAGTGKTYLAMYEALCYLWNKKHTGITRIVLTRPAVEAGEKLGFLPGMLEEKMDPYMRPLYDSLYDIAGQQTGQEKIKKGIIEIAPVAFMRGRTFHNTFLILDEAQNCTYDQLKMVLTRLGENVKLIVNGDSSQSDLNGRSGLKQMIDATEKTEDVGVVRFKNRDVERSQIVKSILTSIEGYERKR